MPHCILLKQEYRPLTKNSRVKTLKQVPVELLELTEGEYIPEEMEFGKIYFSPELK